MAKTGPLLPILGGAAGGLITVLAADRLGMNPNIAAWGATAAGIATALGTKGAVSQVATGFGSAGAALGTIQLASSAKAHAAKKEDKKRQAEAESNLVSRQLNEGLARMADMHQKQCEVMTALVNKLDQFGSPPLLPPASRPCSMAQRGAAGDEERNAFVEDDYARNAYGAEDERNAVIDEERNAFVEDDYARNAYGDDERNALPRGMFHPSERLPGQRVTYAQPVGVRSVPADEGFDYAADDQTAFDDGRNAYVEDERNAFVDDERNAVVEEVPAA